ncbi:hypothetical protein AB0758_46010 [Tolypothrix bouteillei VB521301_2]
MCGNGKEELYTHIESLVYKDFDIIYNFDNNSFPTLTHRKSRLNFKLSGSRIMDGIINIDDTILNKFCTAFSNEYRINYLTTNFLFHKGV